MYMLDTWLVIFHERKKGIIIILFFGLVYYEYNFAIAFDGFCIYLLSAYASPKQTPHFASNPSPLATRFDNTNTNNDHSQT